MSLAISFINYLSKVVKLELNNGVFMLSHKCSIVGPADTTDAFWICTLFHDWIFVNNSGHIVKAECILFFFLVKMVIHAQCILFCFITIIKLRKYVIFIVILTRKEELGRFKSCLSWSSFSFSIQTVKKKIVQWRQRKNNITNINRNFGNKYQFLKKI